MVVFDRISGVSQSMKRVYFLLLPLFLLLMFLIPLIPVFMGEEGGVVSMDRPVDSPSVNAFSRPNLFVFFGYVGCADVCTPRLSEMAAVYDGLSNETRRRSAVLFINIKTFPDKNLADLFAKSFHPDFYGISPEKEELARLIKEFNVYYSNALFEEGEMDHTAFLFLLKKRGDGYRVNKIFTRIPLQKETIIKSLE